MQHYHRIGSEIVKKNGEVGVTPKGIRPTASGGAPGKKYCLCRDTFKNEKKPTQKAGDPVG